MVNYSYSSDPSYTIRTRLAEYYEILCNLEDYYEFSLSDIEEELKDAIHTYCVAAENEFDALVEAAHQGIEDQFLDLLAIEDLVLSVSSIVRFICERRENWGKMYFQMESDEYEHPVTNLSEALLYRPCQNQYLIEDFDDDQVRERANQLRAKAGEIYQYIAARTQPVSKETLSNVIIGYSDRALAMAVSRNDILNYRGLYFCIKHIAITDDEKNCVYRYLCRQLADEKTWHIDDLYDDFVCEFDSLVRRAYIQTPYQLFSLIEVLYPKEFNLVRPFLAAIGVHIVSPQERLAKYVQKSVEISVGDFVIFAKENHIKVNSILELIVSLNDIILLKDRETIIQTSATGITPQIAHTVVGIITNEVIENSCMAIRDLVCIPQLPSIAYPWDEWLIYSVLRKWGKNLVVHTTSTQFRQSVPVVALPGMITDEKLAEIAKRCSDLSYTPSGHLIENLDDLDDLILGFIDLDLDFEEGGS